MAYMKPEHVHKLLYKFPLGIIIIFEHQLTNWQKSKNDDSLSIIKNTSNIFNETHHQVPI